MDTAVLILSFGVAILYLITTSLYIAHFITDHNWLKKLKTPFLVFTFLVHLAFLTLLTVKNGYPPIGSVYQMMTMIAFTLTLVYLTVELYIKTSALGGFVISISLVFHTLSAVYMKSYPITVPLAIVNNWVIELHIVCTLLGYSAILIAGIYGLLYLILYRQIQSNHFGILFQRLPNLEIIEKMSYHSVITGFTFMTISLVAGISQFVKTNESIFVRLLDPKLVGVIIIWIHYGVALFVKNQFGWNGKRMSVLFVTGFIVTFLSITFFNLFSPTFHN